jgi:elongation factor P hydroxylase
VADSNIHPDVESQKRRTTRIVQAVPLTVTGVDALGRPFQERTSTLIINCHGCRYQSKHYVLKNMWVMFEVPHSEPGREPRTVRARVNWIQRPRTVRELFQIGVELEISGNVWGIAFPPGDWFPFPESGSASRLEIPAPSETPHDVAEAKDWSTTGEMPAVEPPSPRALEPVEDSVRVLPISRNRDASLQLSQQVARLVMEAKQQIQSTARESANEAVAAETRMLLANLHAQMVEAVKESAASAVAAQIEEAQHEILRNRESEREAALSALREEIAREWSRQASEARQQIDAQLAEVERVRQADFELRIQNQLQAAVQKLESMTQALGAREHEARVTVDQMRLTSEQAATNELRLWQEQMDQRSADAQARLAEMDQAAKTLREQITAAAAIGEGGWRGTLDAELESATERWRERTETLIEEASRRAAEKFGENAEATRRQMEKQLQEGIAVIGDAHSQVAAETESALGKLRAAIHQEIARGEDVFSQLQNSATELEVKRREFSAHVEAASDNLAQRAQAVLETQSGELTRQAESVVAGMAERVQSAVEATGRKTVDELVGELQQRLSPQMALVEEATSKLMFDREQAEKTLAEHQERIWQASDRNLQDTVTRAKELLAQKEREFGESARESIDRWISEIDAKATETTAQTFEALYKSADWYEKRVQNQMQTTLQKGVDQAAAQLREKAAELSGMFARELDKCSRSYVEHAQGQIQESSAEAAERGSQQITDAGNAAAAMFTERAAELGREQFELYASKTRTAFEQNAASMEAHTTQIRAKLEGDARGFAVEFQRALSQHVQQTLTRGIQEMAAQIDRAKESLLNEYQALQRQFGTSLEPLGLVAIDEHKKRLANASNAWLLTTVTKLNQESESLIAELSDSTEKKLKAVCSAVISEMGATLRQRLTEMSAPSPAQANPSPFRAPFKSSEIKPEEKK